MNRLARPASLMRVYTKHMVRGFLGCITLAASFATACDSDAKPDLGPDNGEETPPSYISPKPSNAKVLRVIDGDTIEVQIDGKSHSVRYIGIDTPETRHPSKEVEFLGPEASARNRALVEDKIVQLEKDVSEMDRYGRLLRYVYINGQMVNAILVQEGYAQVSTYPPDVKYSDDLRALQQQAVDQGIGLWSPTNPNTPASSNTSDCDSSYPDVCIPPTPPDLDCKDVSFRRFKVLPPDPHRFDGNKNGVGCEN